MDILVFHKYLLLNLIKKRPLLLVLLELMLIDVCIMVYAMHLLPFKDVLLLYSLIFCEKIVEFFMDDFSVYGKSFDDYLSNLDRVLHTSEQTNLVLNWEKCHFMINEGIVLGHKFSNRGIEVDQAKVDAIEKISCPKDIKGIRSFLGHVGFYRRFTKDLSKICRPLTNLLQKDIHLFLMMIL